MFQTSSCCSAISEKDSEKGASLEIVKTRLKSSNSRHHMSIGDKRKRRQEENKYSIP